MVGPSALTGARVILLAVQLASDSQVSALQYLSVIHPTTLHPELVLRILLSYLPESTEPSLYTPFVQTITTGADEHPNTVGLDTSAVDAIQDNEARKRVRKLRLQPLAQPSELFGPINDPVTLFIFHRAHRIDAQTGLLNMLPELLAPFIDHSEFVRTWLISTILPLLRLSYEYYPQDEREFSLETFESLNDEAGVNTLLSRASDKTNRDASEPEAIGRDIRGLVGAWMYGDSRSKRRKTNTDLRRDSRSILQSADTDVDDQSGIDTFMEGSNGWHYVFDWLVSKATSDFALVVRAIEQWDGPSDVDLGGYERDHGHVDEPSQHDLDITYGRAAMAAIYSATEGSLETLEGAHRILVRVAHIMDLDPPIDLPSNAAPLPFIKRPSKIFDDLTSIFLLSNTLLRPHNPLTSPNEEALPLLNAMVLNALVLAKMSHPLSVKRVAELSLFGAEEDQRRELQRLVQSIPKDARKNDKDWTRIREQLLWLRDGGLDGDLTERTSEKDPDLYVGIFGKLGRHFLETEILKALLEAKCYQLVIETYLKTSNLPGELPAIEVEKVVIETAMTAFDNASSTTRYRGGVKTAAEIIDIFKDFLPSKASVEMCDALISATHSLSFYSLTLKHDLAFHPVSVRTSSDPIGLLGKILEQNPGSYLKLDAILGIGRNMVAAGLLNPIRDEAFLTTSAEEKKRLTRVAERRITGMAIEAALEAQDFDTAYSYIFNRLAPTTSTSISEQVSAGLASSDQQDDVSWQVIFLAGRHQFYTIPESISDKLRRLEQRMELLTQALLLAPPTELPGILTIWRRCEEEMNKLSRQETEEEQEWDDKGDHKVPGAFGNPAQVQGRRRSVARGKNEEAPMGLFDVAKGAASALRKSAFPLRGAASAVAAAHTGSSAGNTATERSRAASQTGSDSGSIGGTETEGRIRKRDVVSNMVTGGLVTGLSFVLGVKPNSTGHELPKFPEAPGSP
ncbi:MAG: hypothetical protein M1827_006825 [Pycnora praestabilis]|nr:MAG: hypothetical protein M1827_006825 [Pycnora praestabilis]